MKEEIPPGLRPNYTKVWLNKEYGSIITDYEYQLLTWAQKKGFELYNPPVSTTSINTLPTQPDPPSKGKTAEDFNPEKQASVINAAMSMFGEEKDWQAEYTIAMQTANWWKKKYEELKASKPAPDTVGEEEEEMLADIKARYISPSGSFKEQSFKKFSGQNAWADIVLAYYRGKQESQTPLPAPDKWPKHEAIVERMNELDLCPIEKYGFLEGINWIKEITTQK